MNRRDFFKLGGAAGALAALTPMIKSKRTHASTRATKSPRRLVLVMAQGGWDTTYALDPKVQSSMVDVPVGAVQSFGNLDVFTDASRPNVTGFFTKYAPQTAIVRGISVASVAHQECVKRMSTGTREETNPDMGAIVAHDLGNDLPLPYLILGDTAFTGEYAVSAGRVGATNQIIALLDPAQAYPTGMANPFDPSDAEDTLLQKYAQASVDRAKAVRGATGYNRKRLDDFVEAIGRGEALKPVRAGFGTRGRTLLLDSQVNLALDALQQDISRAVMLNTRLAWDTHTMNDDQAGFHESTFAGLTALMDQLSMRDGWRAGTKMIDDTVVVCFSEFSRTPKLNANMGKDHWPVTSALIMGAGIAGGKAYGQTTDAMQTVPIDIGGSQTTLMSSHFVGGVLSACGVDPTEHLSTEVYDAFVA